MAYVTQRELNDARNDRIFDAVESAHNRFVRNRANFIESNPNAVSNFERSAILGRRQQMQDEDRLREHEMKMLQQTGQNDLEVAKQNKLGMIGQGSEAARFKANAERYKADAEKAAALKRFETEAANARAQFGYFDAEGKYHGGSDVTRMEAQAKGELEKTKVAGDYSVRQQQEANKGLIAKAEADRITQAINNEAKIEQARIAAGGKVSSAKLMAVSRVMGNAIVAEMGNKDAATVVAELREQYKSDPEALTALDILEEQAGTKTGEKKWVVGKK